MITEILNRVDALVAARLVTFAQVAKETKISARTLYNWFGEKRRDRPNGLGAVVLMNWAAKKTADVAKLPNKNRNAYRTAYLEVCQRFPVKGRKE